MGEARRRKLANQPHREHIIDHEERRLIITNAVTKAISGVRYMWNDMNKLSEDKGHEKI